MGLVVFFVDSVVTAVRCWVSLTIVLESGDELHKPQNHKFKEKGAREVSDWVLQSVA